MTDPETRVHVATVGPHALVECESCGPVGVFIGTSREAAVHHLTGVHGSTTVTGDPAR